MSTDRAAERAAEVRRVAVELCELCLSGTGGECHTPGCALWFSRAPDVPVTHEPVPADQADHAETLGALNQATRERDEARAVLRDIADRGLRADLTPTVTSAMDPGGTYRELTAYLRRLDARIRERARRALEGSSDE